VLDPRRVLADEVLAILLDRRRDRARMARQTALADPVHALIRLDDHEQPVARPDVDDERLERGDLHRARTLR
jgi:hypothetical protein